MPSTNLSDDYKVVGIISDKCYCFKCNDPEPTAYQFRVLLGSGEYGYVFRCFGCAIEQGRKFIAATRLKH